MPTPKEPSEQMFREFVRNVKDFAIFTLDPDGFVTSWNEGAQRLKGYAPEEIVGRHFSIFFPPEDVLLGKPETERRGAELDGRFEGEGFRVRKDGSRFWGNEIVTALRDGGGKLLGFIKIARDLTERRTMEDALRASAETHRLMVENAKDYAIFTLDLAGRVTSWNTGAQRVFGFAEHEIVGRTGDLLFTPEDRAAGVYEQELATALSEGRAMDDRWQQRKGGERFFAMGVTTPLLDAGAGLRGFVKICQDRTEEQQLREQRERLLEQEKIARLEAERAMMMRDQFLSVVSHELRTPLTSILLWSKMLRAGSVKPEEFPQVFKSIEESASSQQQLIEDLLDVSRMMSGKMRLDVRETDLGPVVEAAVDAVRPMAEARGVKVDTAIDPGAGHVRADPDRVQQVVWNLVNNAVKFTAAGGRAAVSLKRFDDTVRIEVTDTGRGIPPEFLPHLFERFRQADATTTRSQGGLGLGLAISRQLVELHGGVIRAASPGEGKGSAFTVDLPLADLRRDDAETGPPAVRSSESFVPGPLLDNKRVLLVEDELATRSALHWLLERCGAGVTSCESAAQAAHTFRRALAHQRFHLVISDIGMPVQDGYELIRELRDFERKAGITTPTPAIALTAYARDQDQSRALAAGFQRHVAKPVEPQVLIDIAGMLLV